jgi:hypothetical protein
VVLTGSYPTVTARSEELRRPSQPPSLPRQWVPICGHAPLGASFMVRLSKSR